MNQKAFGIVFVIVIIIAVGVMLFSRNNNQNQGVQSSPSPVNDLFNASQSDNSGQQPQQQKQQQQQTRQIKQYAQFPGQLSPTELKNKKAVIQTQKGTIEFEIYPEATKAASNFIFLAKDKFYDGIVFHRVEPWVVQGGDPTGTGRGGPGYGFEDEPVARAYERGIVAMANAGPDTSGSQFFILKRDTPLDPAYTIFGKVLEGQDIVDKIAVGDVMQSVAIVPLK